MFQGDGKPERCGRTDTARRDRELHRRGFDPADEACAGSLTFTGGPTFDLFIPTKGKPIWMIQTNQGNVFQGTATKVSH